MSGHLFFFANLLRKELVGSSLEALCFVDGRYEISRQHLFVWARKTL